MRRVLTHAFIFLAFTGFAAPFSSQNSALLRFQSLLADLSISNQNLSSSDRIAKQWQCWNLLTESGPEFVTYGSISGGPICDQDPTTMPINNVGPLYARTALFCKQAPNYLPTNDWIENLLVGCDPVKNRSDNGFHKLTPASNGIWFNVASSYNDWGTALHSMIEVSGWDQGFKLGAVGYDGKTFLAKWQNNDTGNLVRQLYYDSHFWIYVSQGGLFQGAHYYNVIPDLNIDLAVAQKSVIAYGNVKYRVVVGHFIYLIYGNSTFTPGVPYYGNLNVACIPNDANTAQLEALCDKYGTHLIIKGQGTILPDGTYAFQYLCTDLTGQRNSEMPLILLKTHHVKTLLPTNTWRDTGFSLLCVTGPVYIYEGNTFLFEPKQPRTAEAAPNLPSGNPPLTVDQANALCQTNGPLSDAIGTILNNYISSTSIYLGGKIDYQIGLTLHYGTKALEIAGQNVLSYMLPLYQRLATVLSNKINLYAYDSNYGSVIANLTYDYGNHQRLCDHIVQYGFDIASFAFLKQFEDKYLPANQRMMSRPVSMPGYTQYTYQQFVDLLVADIGESSYQNPHFPVCRNLDIYIGHSWLSGLEMKNAESQSENVFGAWAVAYWLKTRGASTDQSQVALTRFALDNESLTTYNHIDDPVKSPLYPIGSSFTGSHNVVSITWGNRKLGDETYWGLNWDRILSCELMPASAGMMDTILDPNPIFTQRTADYILANWSNFDTTNNTQSVLIHVVAKAYGSQTTFPLIADVANRNQFDIGTNAFLLKFISYYADNQKAGL